MQNLQKTGLVQDDQLEIANFDQILEKTLIDPKKSLQVTERNN